MKISAVFGGLVALALALPAVACEEFYEVDNAQGKQLVETLKNPEADEFDQVIAFDTLICAKRVALRNIALRYGRTASSPDVRAQVLHTALFKMPRLVMTFIPEEGMSKEAREFLKTTPVWTLEIGKRFPDQNCMSLGGGSDCDSNLLQIVGNKVQVSFTPHWAHVEAQLNLSEDGMLIGWFINRKDKGIGKLPVEIILQ
ncbi:MAG: hypothetical protein ACFBRM_09845 [Pikeienuella sp.]